MVLCCLICKKSAKKNVVISAAHSCFYNVKILILLHQIFIFYFINFAGQRFAEVAINNDQVSYPLYNYVVRCNIFSSVACNSKPALFIL